MPRTDFLSVLLAFIAACATAFVLTPLAKKFAVKVGAVDKPGGRHIHTVPTPLMGGLAIFFGFMVSLLIFTPIDRTLFSIILGSLVIVTISAIDDIYDLSPVLRLAIHFFAACIVVFYGGMRINVLSTLGISESPDLVLSSWAADILTAMWIVAVTNAVNWIDGLDGLAAGVSAISAISLIVISVLIGNPGMAIIMAGLAGAIMGFLPYNLHPAKIFMGDTGAMWLGFILATLSIQGLFKFYVIIGFLVPVLVLGLPIIDICITSLRRLAQGHNPMISDRSHLHHQLIDLGFTQKQAVAILYCISALLGIAAVILTVSARSKGIMLIVTIVIGLVFTIYILPKKARSAKNKNDEPSEENSKDQTPD